MDFKLNMLLKHSIELLMRKLASNKDMNEIILEGQDETTTVSSRYLLFFMQLI